MGVRSCSATLIDTLRLNVAMQELTPANDHARPDPANIISPRMNHMHAKSAALAITLAVVTQPLFAQTAEHQARFESLAKLFQNASVIGTPTIVDCTLSGGAESFCFSITTGPAPSNHKTGPYCPRTINTPAEDSGTWFINDEVTAADGQFIENLAVIYQDDEWQMFDPDTGDVILVEGELGCAVAGDPTSAADYKNYCVECEIKYLENEVSETYVIPLIPVPCRHRWHEDRPKPWRRVGVQWRQARRACAHGDDRGQPHSWADGCLHGPRKSLRRLSLPRTGRVRA